MLLNSKLNHIDLGSTSVNMTYTPCPPQHKSIIVYLCHDICHDICIILSLHFDIYDTCISIFICIVEHFHEYVL